MRLLSLLSAGVSFLGVSLPAQTPPAVELPPGVHIEDLPPEVQAQLAAQAGGAQQGGADAAAQDVWLTAERLSPKAVTQYRYPGCARSCVFGDDGSPSTRIHTEESENVSVHMVHADAECLAPSVEVGVASAHPHHVLEDAVPLAPVT